MNFAQTSLLGAIAGFTIYLGLPAGRISWLGARGRVALAMFSVGILSFIFMDVARHAQEIVAAAVDSFKGHHAGFGHVVGMFTLLAAGFTAGTAGIATIERRVRDRRPPPITGGVDIAAAGPQVSDPAERAALQRGMTVAVAIGLHNFAEGLAVGVSARAGNVGLATVLIIGFGLHNATEGFGIVGPLGGVRPTWRWLGLAGLIAGGPTLLGTLVGYRVHSDALELCFLGLAGGAILYVVGEIWTAMHRRGFRTLGLYCLAGGFLLGVLTDLIVSYGGG